MKYIILICFALIFNYIAARDEHLLRKGVTQRFQELTELTAKTPIISLNFSMFKEYVRTPVRDYSFIVMFNSFKLDCPNCKPMYEEFKLVVDTFINLQSRDKKLFFGIVDFEAQSNIFDMMRIDTVPAVMHFPSKDEPAAAMDVGTFGIKAEAIAKWVNNRADTRIRVQRSQISDITMPLAFNILIIATGFFFFRKNLSFIYNPHTWATEAVVFCIIMMSGSMWHHTYRTPSFGVSKNGLKIFENNFNAQFRFESYIIALITTAVMNGLIMMVEAAGGVNWTLVVRTPTERKIMRVRCLYGLLFVMVFISLLMYVFRIKLPVYPIGLLF